MVCNIVSHINELTSYKIGFHPLRDYIIHDYDIVENTRHNHRSPFTTIVGAVVLILNDSFSLFHSSGESYMSLVYL